VTNSVPAFFANARIDGIGCHHYDQRNGKGMTMSTARGAGTGPALMVLFALSGFAGLIYESIWTQYLGLFLGHAAYAQSFVLTLFMGGMAIGAWLVSRRSASLARPLAVYAGVEFLIGVFGIAFDPLYHAATGFAYTEIFPRVGEGMGLDLARYAISVAIIGVQCIALGATFPLMSAGYLRSEPAAGGRVLAGLYFSNSFGAALGALIATFVLLPRVGLPGTVMAGGIVSILVAILVWPLGKTASFAADAAAAAKPIAIHRLIFVAAALTGATSFVYEITWIRMLALALGSTMHAFELMLAAFIGGIAFGGLWLRSRADAWRDAVAAAGWAQVAMGIAALFSLFVYARSFDWVATLMQGLSPTPTGYTLYHVATGAIAVAVMFPAAFFAGTTLPLLTLALLRRGAGETAIGRVYAANTVGAIAGVLLAMHVLMPLIGVRYALWLAALVDLALGIVLLARADVVVRQRILIAVGVSLVVAVCAVAFTRVDPSMLASGVYRSGHASLQDAQMLFYGDGKTATVALYERNGTRAIATNGKVDASIVNGQSQAPSVDEYTMGLLSILPLALQPQPKNVAVIGFGSGMTVDTLLHSKRVERIDVIEIEPFMVRAARKFGDRVARAYTDPRAHIVIDDAKAFLAGAVRKYDVIVSEPSNPWVNGVAALFSDEFYAFVPQHLTDDGVFVQWLQLYEITPDLVASVLKGMLPHFADVQAYISNGGDMLLVASPRKMLPALTEPADLDPSLDATLERLSMRTRDQLALFSLTDRRGLTALAALGDQSANSDLFPILQLDAPLARFTRSSAMEISDLQGSNVPLLEVVGGIGPISAAAQFPSSPTHLRRDEMRRAALEYRDALLNGSRLAGHFSPAESAYRLSQLRDPVADCAQFDAVRWVEASVQIAGATTTTLTADDLHGVWIDPKWVPACARTAPLSRKVLDLYAAMSERRWRDVADSGRELLTQDIGQVGPEFASYVLRATQLAFLSIGDAKSVSDLETIYGAPIKDRPFERRFLQATANNPAQSASTPDAGVSAKD
jgi:spermidine synthase